MTNDNTYYYRATANNTDGFVSGLSHVSSTTPRTDVIPPWGMVVINDGDQFTSTPTVTLSITTASDVVEMRISDTPRFSDVSWTPIQDSLSWTVAEAGNQFVYMQFRDASGNIGGEPVHEGVPGQFSWDNIVFDPEYVPPGLPFLGWILVLGGGAVVVVVVVGYLAIRRGWIRIKR